MASSMYLETPLQDEEQVSLVDSRRSTPTRYVSTVVAAVALVAVALGGSLMRGNAVPFAAVGEQVGLDLDDSEVHVKLDITGVRYSNLDNTAWDDAASLGVDGAGNAKGPPISKCKLDQDLTPHLNGGGADTIDADKQKSAFKYALQTAVANKAKVKATSVVLEEEPASSTGKILRTTALLKLIVPSSLSASAVLSRLNDGSSLMWDIKELLTGCHIPREGDITPHAVMESKMGSSELSVVETDSNPSFTVELDVQGIYYRRLALSADLKTAFVNAIRTGIIPDGVQLKPESIGLDILDGETDADDVPYVIVSASVPVPAGLAADATMSRWPGGREGIGRAITEKLQAIPNIKETSRKEGTVGWHEIQVLPGPLRLGGIRLSYKRQVDVVMEVTGLETAEVGSATKTSLQSVLDKVKESLLAAVGKDKNVEVVFLKDNLAGATRVEEVADHTLAGDITILNNADIKKVRASVSQFSHITSTPNAAEWESKLIPAVRTVDAYFKKNGIKSNAKIPIEFATRPPKVSNSPDTFDLDLVVHGINYDAVSAQTQGAFLDDLASAVRDSLENGVGGAHITTVKSSIRVAVSSQDSTGAINVKVSIPTPDVGNDLMTFESLLDRKVIDGTLKTSLETTLRDMPGVAYLSTWTPKAISVSMPGQINDYSGDSVGEGDDV